MPYLIVESGEGIGKTFSLEGEIVIGRTQKDKSKQAQVALNDSRVSRKHALIYQKEGSFFVRDLGSTNGTFLNNKKLQGEEEIKPGDLVRIGLHWLSFRDEQQKDRLEEVLDDFDVLNKIGAGGMADVYRVRQKSLDRVVALKLLPNALLREDKNLARAFVNEARALARLDHPHVIKMLDFQTNPQATYFVTEFVDAPSLEDILKEKGALEPLEALDIIKSIGEGLAAAHNAGVVHLDMKPGNVIISDNILKIIDFGLARIYSSGTKQDGESGYLGTFEYISPEQIEGKDTTPASDIYSLGVMLFQMVTGELPYTAENTLAVINKHLSAPVPVPSETRAGLTGSIDQLVVKMMAKNSTERFQSGSEFVEAVDQARQGLLAKEDIRSAEKEGSAGGNLLAHPWLWWVLLPVAAVAIKLLVRTIF